MYYSSKLLSLELWRNHQYLQSLKCPWPLPIKWSAPQKLKLPPVCLVLLNTKEKPSQLSQAANISLTIEREALCTMKCGWMHIVVQVNGVIKGENATQMVFSCQCGSVCMLSIVQNLIAVKHHPSLAGRCGRRAGYEEEEEGKRRNWCCTSHV